MSGVKDLDVAVATLAQHGTALSTVTSEGKRTASNMTPRHMFSNITERRRVVADHPGEPDVVRGDRVLGHLPVSRSQY